MNEPHEGPDVIKQWITRAEHDLLTAEHTLTLTNDCPYDTVCFHGHQCVEKYLKAYLLSQSLDFPKTHDLRLLVQLAQSSGSIEFDVVQIVALNRYAIEARYPGDWDPMTRSEAEQAVVVARKVRELVRIQLA